MTDINMIDKLRSVPAGHTASSNITPKALKRAAERLAELTTATVVATTSLAAEEQRNENRPVANEHTIELNEPRQASDYIPMDSTYDATADFTVEPSTPIKEQSLNPEDIRVSYEKEHLVVQGNDGSVVIMHEDEFNGRRMEKEENREHRRTFSGKSETQYTEITLEQVRAQIRIDSEGNACGAPPLGLHNEGTNSIVVYRAPFSEEEINKNLEQANLEGNKTEIAVWSYYADLKKIENNPELANSIEFHENSHLDDEREGLFKENNVTDEQSAKLDMMTEIKATFNQVALGYEKYLQTGNIEDIKGWHAGDLKEFKEWLQQNPDKAKSDECKARLTQAVQNGWLERNNNNGATYYSQAMTHITPNVTNQRQAGARVEHIGNETEYNRRVQEMFSDTHLGDVSAYINPNITLGLGANTQAVQEAGNTMTQAQRFVLASYDDAQTVREATSNARDVLNLVRDVDKDGVRTPEEQSRVEQMVQSVVNNSKQLDKKTQDGITVARKTGRGWQNRSSSKQDTGRTIVKENTNGIENTGGIDMAVNIKNMNQGRT